MDAAAAQTRFLAHCKLIESQPPWNRFQGRGALYYGPRDAATALAALGAEFSAEQLIRAGLVDQVDDTQVDLKRGLAGESSVIVAVGDNLVPVDKCAGDRALRLFLEPGSFKPRRLADAVFVPQNVIEWAVLRAAGFEALPLPCLSRLGPAGANLLAEQFGIVSLAKQPRQASPISCPQPSRPVRRLVLLGWSLFDRAKGLDPTATKSLHDFCDLLKFRQLDSENVSVSSPSKDDFAGLAFASRRSNQRWLRDAIQRCLCRRIPLAEFLNPKPARPAGAELLAVSRVQRRELESERSFCERQQRSIDDQRQAIEAVAHGILEIGADGQDPKVGLAARTVSVISAIFFTLSQSVLRALDDLRISGQPVSGSPVAEDLSRLLGVVKTLMAALRMLDGFDQAKNTQVRRSGQR